MKFSANLSTLYRDAHFLDRFRLAAEAGFSAVEFWWPTENLKDVEAAVKQSRLHVAVFNFAGGEMAAGERGLLSNPATFDEFRENVPVALELATRLECQKLNLLVGLALEGVPRQEQLELARKGLRWAARQAAAADVEVLVEALNTRDLPGYLLDNSRDAVAFIQSVGEPNVRLLYDVYHMQRMEGNLTANLREHKEYIGHIQIADSPDRGEPGTGEINFPYVLQVIEELGYDGYVGLEYLPRSTDTESSLRWLPRELRASDVAISDLRL